MRPQQLLLLALAPLTLGTLSPSPPPPWYWNCPPSSDGGILVQSTTVVSPNNLAGGGPDAGEEAIVFQSVSTATDGTVLDFVISDAADKFVSKNTDGNGKNHGAGFALDNGGFASFNIKAYGAFPTGSDHNCTTYPQASGNEHCRPNSYYALTFGLRDSSTGQPRAKGERWGARCAHSGRAHQRH
jgi:hypothetical protein